MKHLLILGALMLTLVPQMVSAMTEAEAKRQLALEAANLVSFGNPFGKTGKFEELYDPTGKPWWMIQLAKEAWSMETYGNPFGYFIPQRVLQPHETPSSHSLPLPMVPNSESSGGMGESQPAPSDNGGGSSNDSPTSDLPDAPRFVVGPYFIPTEVNDGVKAKGIAVQFSEPLLEADPGQKIYRLFCVTPGYPNGVNIATNGSSDKSTRSAQVTEALGHGHYSCRFKFTSPIVIESQTIEFDL